jgi:hypothetical protein
LFILRLLLLRLILVFDDFTFHLLQLHGSV